MSHCGLADRQKYHFYIVLSVLLASSGKRKLVIIAGDLLHEHDGGSEEAYAEQH